MLVLLLKHSYSSTKSLRPIPSLSVCSQLLLLSSFFFSNPSAPTSRELGLQHQLFAVFTHIHTLSGVLSSTQTMLADFSKPLTVPGSQPSPPSPSSSSTFSSSIGSSHEHSQGSLSHVKLGRGRAEGLTILPSEHSSKQPCFLGWEVPQLPAKLSMPSLFYSTEIPRAP